ncbi:MAG: enoyl-CoA hydratase/isomerase family protein [Ignavibacteriales bacterium]
MAEKVNWEKIGRTAVITFKQVTVDPEFIEDFCSVMDEIENQKNIRVVVIAGAKGKIFFSGYDIGLVSKNLEISYQKGSTLEVQRLMNRVEHCVLPVIGIVDGYAVGGGCELLLACDLVYASERAVMGTPEVRIGLIPAAGGTIRLPKQVGKHRAMEMILTGKLYSAKQASEMGIVNEVFHHDELWDEALKIANIIADNAPIAVKAGKYNVVSALTLLDKQMELITVDACIECLRSEDIKEGAAAFVEKRKPHFTGK